MKKILIVDDNKEILALLKIYLTFSGYHVIVSPSASEGLELFYRQQPDLVILDINIGASDGREMCRQIKSQEDYKRIPVIMTSANTESLGPYAEYGANAALEKPFQFQNLRQVMAASWPE